VALFAIWEYLPLPLNAILLVLGLFLILLILIQRGKGGGLVGALSGVGGSSPFGSRAGDTFTRITIYVAAVWLLLTMVQVRAIQEANMQREGSGLTLAKRSSGQGQAGAFSDAPVPVLVAEVVRLREALPKSHDFGCINPPPMVYRVLDLSRFI
jgi:preprotein translocase subunit SecG